MNSGPQTVYVHSCGALYSGDKADKVIRFSHSYKVDARGLGIFFFNEDLCYRRLYTQILLEEGLSEDVIFVVDRKTAGPSC